MDSLRVESSVGEPNFRRLNDDMFYSAVFARVPLEKLVLPFLSNRSVKKTRLMLP